jgi:hypothetical protein
MFGGRSRTCSESSEGAGGDTGGGQRLGSSAPTGGFLTAGLLGEKAAQKSAAINNNNNVNAGGTAYDLEGKFTYSQVSSYKLYYYRNNFLPY